MPVTDRPLLYRASSPRAQRGEQGRELDTGIQGRDELQHRTPLTYDDRAITALLCLCSLELCSPAPRAVCSGRSPPAGLSSLANTALMSQPPSPALSSSGRVELARVPSVCCLNPRCSGLFPSITRAYSSTTSPSSFLIPPCRAPAPPCRTGCSAPPLGRPPLLAPELRRRPPCPPPSSSTSSSTSGLSPPELDPRAGSSPPTDSPWPDPARPPSPERRRVPLAMPLRATSSRAGARFTSGPRAGSRAGSRRGAGGGRAVEARDRAGEWAAAVREEGGETSWEWKVEDGGILVQKFLETH